PQWIALDTMNFWIQGKKEALLKTIGRVNALFINEGEARQLTGESNLVKAAQKIREQGPKTLVIKRGEYGALLFHEKEIFAAPALPLEDVKDPTGAGDSFAGGFIGHLARTQDFGFENLKKACICGSVMASFIVEEFSLDRFRRLPQKEIDGPYGKFPR